MDVFAATLLKSMMKIIEIELVLTHSPRKNAPSQVELFSVFYFESVRNILEN